MVNMHTMEGHMFLSCVLFCSVTMAGHCFRKAGREEDVGNAKCCQRKNSHLFKKKFSSLNFFFGHPRNIDPQERKLLFEDTQGDLQRKESKKLKATRKEVCSLGKPPSGTMCPKCEIIICRECNMLHTESSFIAHSLLDHYDQGRHTSCCSDARFSQDHHVCLHTVQIKRL